MDFAHLQQWVRFKIYGAHLLIACVLMMVTYFWFRRSKRDPAERFWPELAVAFLATYTLTLHLVVFPLFHAGIPNLGMRLDPNNYGQVTIHLLWIFCGPCFVAAIGGVLLSRKYLGNWTGGRGRNYL